LSVWVVGETKTSSSNNGNWTTAIHRVTYAAPSITSLSLVTGAAGGGNSITVTGSRFVPGTTVAFGSVPASSVTYNSPEQLTVTAPAGVAGTVADVRATT